ncbi:MAG: hypothetical protein JO227_07655 [Acetobacteraceae bacterium]|nr:hypothetical protein [Acetobacteraceae bacterium]
MPLQWAYAQNGLAIALAELAQRQKSPAHMEEALMEEALICLRHAVEVYQQSNERYRWPIAQRRMSNKESCPSH